MSALIAAGSNPLEFLTQFGIEWRLLVSQGVSFAIVACALYYLAFKPVMAAADKRREKIEKGLKDAEEAAAKLAAAKAEADKQAAEAALEATRILESARADAKAVVEKAAAAAEQAAEIRRQSDEQLAQDRERMKRELRDELCVLVAKAAEEAVNGILTPEQRKKLDERAAEELAEGK